MKRALIVFLLLALPLSAQTVRNNESCDVAQFPAATLLLPYFEVHIDEPATTAKTTIFSIVNASKQPQIANVTLWTDWGYPLLTFQLFLTGYDAQTINLYDVIARGIIGSTSSNTKPGARSQATNPNFAATAATDCASAGGVLPAGLLTEIRTALTTGRVGACGDVRAGGTHPYAVGSVTIDVVNTCKPVIPNTTAYYDSLLYDNVLTGDFFLISPNPTTGNYAGGNPLVHIRAVPEGGPAGTVRPTNLPYTFYDRYTPRAARTMDRRQPLPSQFAARFIQGGPTSFDTWLSIWREGVDTLDTACSAWSDNAVMTVADVVRFDERENPFVLPPPPPILGPPNNAILPAVSRTPTSSFVFPTLTSGDVAGWLYLDLNNGGSEHYSSTRPLAEIPNRVRASQGWVTVGMTAEGRYSTETNATVLANGCSPARALLDHTIGPGGNVTP